eukprot:TRINITY_DN14694_c0_g1_i2.p1 TRINITY_DN14694_c0_g1~~TRINITY_DN14694_c0_g1_i2.p1  ORF type:complete len:527 (+),score=48.26 TRINITY_DN14694_c0_g1_i2:192-1772(+)
MLYLHKGLDTHAITRDGDAPCDSKLRARLVSEMQDLLEVTHRDLLRKLIRLGADSGTARDEEHKKQQLRERFSGISTAYISPCISDSQLQSSHVPKKRMANSMDVMLHHSSSLTNAPYMDRESWLEKQSLALKRMKDRFASSSKGCMHLSFIDTIHFDVFSGLVIVLHCLLIGIETQRDTLLLPKSMVLQTINYCLGAWYVIELSMRLCHESWTFFYRKNMNFKWNMIDLLLCITTVMDIVADIGSFDNDLVSSRSIRAFRLLRIARLIRAARMMRHVRTVNKMLFAISSSVQTLLWSLMFLFAVIFLFANVITLGALEDLIHDNPDPRLVQHFGTLGLTMYSLFLSIAEGVSWHVLMEPLMELDATIPIVFFLYIAIAVFGITNVLTSIFVESATWSTQHYKELMMQEAEFQRQTSLRHMKEVFNAIDTDGSGSISAEEFDVFLNDDSTQLSKYIAALDVKVEDALTLFHLMDIRGTGEINIEDFCASFARVQGEAKSYDVQIVLCQNRRILHALNQLTHMHSLS